jgi:hypothetical protein
MHIFFQKDFFVVCLFLEIIDDRASSFIFSDIIIIIPRYLRGLKDRD